MDLDPQVFAIRQALRDRGHDLRLVGGAVRSHVRETTPRDIDLTTDASSQVIREALSKIGIFHSKQDLPHGLVVAWIDYLPYDIVPLKQRSGGASADHWVEDLSTRDFTMNAMSMSLEGEILDPFDGEQDARNGIVRFRGAPFARVMEDPIRILRYVRFSRWLQQEVELDDDVRSAIEAGLPKLKGCLNFRLATEIGKIFDNREEAVSTLTAMQELGILSAMGFPAIRNLDLLPQVLEQTDDLATVLAVLFGPDVMDVDLAWKPVEKHLFIYLKVTEGLAIDEDVLRGHMVHDVPRKGVVARALVARDLELADRMNYAIVPSLPLMAHIFLQHGWNPAPKVRAEIERLRQIWIESDYKLTEDQLIGRSTMSNEELLPKSSENEALEKSFP